MDPAKYEYQSEFAKRYFSQGKEKGRAEGEAKGRAEGKAEFVLKQLFLKFGKLPASVEKRVRAASLAELERFTERVLSAATLAQVLERSKPEKR